MNDKNSPSSGSSDKARRSADVDAASNVQPAHQWEFDIQDRGYRVRASYQDELGNNVEIYHGERLLRAFTYEGYRIWNIAAHFRDYVDEFLAEQNALWRTAYMPDTNMPASGIFMTIANDNLVAAINLREREKEVFPLLGTQLTPLRERINICDGWGEEECGDEIPMDKEWCAAHERMMEEDYHRRMLEAEGYVIAEDYPHLTDQSE